MKGLDEIVAENRRAIEPEVLAILAALSPDKRLKPVVRINPRTGAKVVVYE